MDKNKKELDSKIESQLENNCDLWFPKLDLDLSWSALLKAFIDLLAKKMRITPQPVEKVNSQPKWW
ncbi:MAG: hypothetical protein ACW98F_12680 [Candidatus Hodarchaeales archaeon]|jgi:hypothetical protein